jgi:hypothetical protein
VHAISKTWPNAVAGRRLVEVGLVAILLVASGCAAARTGGPWAGISEYDAGAAARDIVGNETSRPDSPIYRTELAVVDIKQGVLPDRTRPVWVISLENFNNARSRYCVFLWGKFVPFQSESVKYDIAPCPSSGDA